ncbi:MAG: HNH endonuclease [Bacteroidales bacterium]
MSQVQDNEKDQEKDQQHGPYGAVLLDIRWRMRRQQIIERDGGKCLICKSTDNLEVHHRQYHFHTRINRYAMPWDYPDDVLITLCQRCHREGHRLYKIPTLYL